MRPKLLPVPRSIEWTDESVAAEAPPSFEHDGDVPPEGFAIDVQGGRYRVRHSDAQGKRYAAALLEDLREQSGPLLPGVRIHDAPDFPVRGLMLDVSRDRVPTRETLSRWLDVMEIARLNQLQLYIEHTFAYRDHAEIWRDASPITPEDVAWLDDACAKRGIELVPNLNTFGHMGRWLSHAAYRGRAEAPEGWDGPTGARRAPAVLAPTQENADFAVGLTREMQSAFRSNRVHIGCDETFELGAGVSREDVEARGVSRVYLDHLKRILEPIQKDGAEVLFWGDILRSEPDLVAELPRERVVALAWHYEAPLMAPRFPEPLRPVLARFGITEETARGFESQIQGFAESGVPFWVCPGTSSWNSLLGRRRNARANMIDAAKVGHERGASGFLLTDWGDNGHLQPPSVSFEAVLMGGALAWGVEENQEIQVGDWLDRSVFQDTTRSLGGILAQLGGAYERTGLEAFNASPLFDGLLPGRCLVTGSLDVAATTALADDLSGWRDALEKTRPGCEDGELVVRELRQAVRLARQGAWRLLRRANAVAPDDDTLRRDLEEAIDEQRSCWLARSRVGGLEDSLDRLRSQL